MKTLIALSLLATAMVPAVALADTTRGELRRDRQDIREERREYRDAVRYGDRSDIREEREEYGAARREYREDLRDWRGDRRHLNNGRWDQRYGYSYGGRGLPHVRGPYRWVRDHRDALLIDIRNGSVRRVIPGFYRHRR
jgi:Ni/Co efflux regulator RcnB